MNSLYRNAGLAVPEGESNAVLVLLPLRAAPTRMRIVAPEHAAYWRSSGNATISVDPSRAGRED